MNHDMKTLQPAPRVLVVQDDLPDGVTFPNGMVAIDTETTGLAVTKDKLCLCQVGDGLGNVWLIQFKNGYEAPNLKALMVNPRVVKLFHFARFDVAILQHNLQVQVAPFFCTKVASKLIYAADARHNLRSLVERYCGVILDKSEQMSDWTVAELSASQQAYAASDVLYLHAIFNTMRDELASKNLNHMMSECLAFLATRVEMDLRGMPEGDVFAHK